MKSVSIGCGVNNIEVCAFANCPELTDVYCLTESVPSTNSDAFKNSYIEYATLHVPAESVNAYKAADPWKNSKSIVSLDNGDSPEQTETQKCATPTISYANGKLTFASATEGAEFVTNISDADIKTHHGNEISLTATYNISVRATRAGYEDSETATATYSWNGIIPMMNGDVAKYRLSFIVNNKELSVRNVEVGTNITVPTTTDDEGNTITWYTYPSTMPAHDLIVYGMVVKQAEPEVFVWLTVKDGQGTTKMRVKHGSEQVLSITPEEGWKLLTVTMDGQDVTAQVKNGGTLTTPAIMQDATIAVVYEQEVPSEVAAARQSKADVKVVDDGVVISNAEPDTRCTVYASSGQQVVSTVLDGGTRKITLPKGQVYVLTLGARTLKFAL